MSDDEERDQTYRDSGDAVHMTASELEERPVTD